MKKYDLELTFNNIKETIINDPIGQRSALINFLKLLDVIDTETSISLDGDWGSGKTFFVKQAILCLQLTNKYLKDFYADKGESFPSQKDYEDIKGVLGEQILHDRLLIPVYFNAWKYDSFGEPVLALIYETLNTFVNSGKFKGDDDIKNGILDVAKNIISSFKTKITMPSKDPNSPSLEIDFDGEKFSAIFGSFEEFKGPNYLKQFEEEDLIKKQIFNLFEKLCTERGDKFIIFFEKSKYHSFIDGKEAELFIYFMMGKEIDFYLRKFDELSKNSIGTEPGRNGVLRFVYEKIFSINMVNDFYETCLSSFMTFEYNHKKKLLKSLTCLAILDEY